MVRFPLPPGKYKARKSDISQLEALYAGREALHGELHDHSNSGGTTDGKVPLAVWPHNLKNLHLDFAAIVDHRQSMHMHMDVWDNSLFIGGTETGHRRYIGDVKNKMHFNILISDADKFEQLLGDFPEFNFHEGYFLLKPTFSEPRFAQMCQAVMDRGGMIVHVHPAHEGYLDSPDPLDYALGDGTGLEVFCGYYGNMSHPGNQKGYDIWVKLLNMGKRVYATSGSDSHRLSKTVSAATLYSDKRDAEAYIQLLRKGDLTAGPVGIRMCIGDTVTGGYTSFISKRLVIAVGDFHILEHRRDHSYRLDLYNEKGLVFSREFDSSKTAYFAINTEDCKYYRANVYDATDDYIVAVGNPIWNKKGE